MSETPPPVVPLISDASLHSISPLQVGRHVLIRTVTHYHVGRIAELSVDAVVLVDAAWVADTGRLSDALLTGTVGEAEPFPDPVAVSRGSIVDVTLWKGKLPLARQ